MSADIYEQYDKIYRYCYFKVRNSALAEDLTQETFLKYFEQTSYTEHGRQMAYLYVIARNLCMDSFRRKKTEELSSELIEEMPCENPFEGTELTLVIRQALSNLTDEAQELLLLRYANELSVNELSKLYGLSRFAVYRKTNAALADLKTLLREEDFS